MILRVFLSEIINKVIYRWYISNASQSKLKLFVMANISFMVSMIIGFSTLRFR
jgi:hypothetical protein